MSLPSGSGPRSNLAPRNGRPAAGIQSNDLAHWETTVTTANEDMALGRFQMRRAILVSPSVVALSAPCEAALKACSREEGLIVRDLDGHAVKVVQP
jgi:hypothetical protein